MDKKVEMKMQGISLDSNLSSEYPKGSYLTIDQMKALQIEPMAYLTPDIIELSTAEGMRRLSFDNNHNLETFQIEAKDTGIQYFKQFGAEQVSIAPQQIEHLMGLRNATTKEIIIEAAYFDLRILNEKTVLVNGWLVIPIKYLDGTITYSDHQYHTPNLMAVKPSDVIFKIFNQDYRYGISVDNHITLIKAAEIYKTTLFGYKREELETMGVISAPEPIRQRRRTKGLWE